MEGTAVLERELDQYREKVAYEDKAKGMPSAYDLLRAQTNGRTSSPVIERREEALSSFDGIFEREKAYFAAPARKKVLFEDYAYVNGELLRKHPETEEMLPVFGAKASAQPVAETVAEVADFDDVQNEPVVTTASIAAPEYDEKDEDALPTRRTLESVIRSEAVQEVTITDAKTGVRIAFTALSSKLKAIVLSVAAAILLAIVLICVNTSIIRSLDSDLTDLKSRATEQQTIYEQLQKETDLYTNSESEIVSEWAERNGMTK